MCVARFRPWSLLYRSPRFRRRTAINYRRDTHDTAARVTSVCLASSSATLHGLPPPPPALLRRAASRCRPCAGVVDTSNGGQLQLAHGPTLQRRGGHADHVAESDVGDAPSRYTRAHHSPLYYSRPVIRACTPFVVQQAARQNPQQIHT